MRGTAEPGPWCNGDIEVDRNQFTQFEMNLPSLPTNTPPAPKPKASLAARIIVSCAVLFGAFFVFRVVQFAVYLRTHPLKYAPGTQQLEAATTLITTARHGTALGNSAEAIGVAEKVSAELKTIRQTMFSGGNADSIDVKALTKGEFVVFCQLNRESCAVLIHVPEMRSYTSSAAKSMAAIAYNSVAKALSAEKKQLLRKLVVATRGTMMYDTILVGESGFDAADPSNRADPMQHEGMNAPGLTVFFAEK